MNSMQEKKTLSNSNNKGSMAQLVAFKLKSKTAKYEGVCVRYFFATE